MQQGDLTVLVMSGMIGIVYPAFLVYACQLMYGA